MPRPILSRKINPFFQAGGILAAIIIFQGLGALIEQIAGFNLGKYFDWEVFAAFILFYALSNSVLGLTSEHHYKYWIQSIIGYILLLFLGGLCARYFSGFGINDAASMRWIIMVFSLGYMIFLTIMNLMRTIVNLAIKQDKKLRGED